jgi:hypothetical protein
MFGFYKKMLSSALKRAEEAEKKLYEYMDITRKEVMESYRKGLQDGLNINLKQETPPAELNPVKSMKEHEINAEQTRKAKEETDKFMTGLQNLINYDGSPQKSDEKA